MGIVWRNWEGKTLMGGKRAIEERYEIGGGKAFLDG